MIDVLESLFADGEPAPDVERRTRRNRPARPAGPPMRGFRPDIEGLRALAVAAIVAADAGLDLPGRRAGLTLFCVIAGFLGTRHLIATWPITGPHALPAYVGARIGRTFPPIAAVTIAVVTISWAWLRLGRPSDRIDPVPAALAHLHPISATTLAVGLGVGALVALLSPEFAPLGRRLAELIGAIGLLLVLGSFAVPHPTAPAVFGASLVLAAGTAARRRIERLLGESLLQCLGRISFSWYLWTGPLFVLAPLVAGRALDWQARVVLVWVSVVIAIASYFAFEQPHRRLRLGTAATAALVLALTLPALVVLPTSGRTDAARAEAAAFAPLDAAVAAGVAIRVTPPTLSPSLAAAAADRPVSDSTACHADYLTINQPACVYGDPNGTHTAVLFGDAHADMWLPAFDAAAKQAHWKVVDWTKSACPAANLTVVNSDLNRTYTECDTWRIATLRQIAALRPDVVFVSDSETVVGASVSAQQWSTATLQTMSAVHTSSGAKVILMQDVPVPARPMPACVGSHPTDVTACTFALAQGYSFPARHAQLGTDAARAGYEVVDPAPWICTKTRCPAIVANHLVYRDDTNLSATFSDWLAPRILPVLRGL